MVLEISDRYHLDLDPDAIIENLPVGVQQRVEIVKVLMRDAQIVVFDEPTAVLTPGEIIEFFGIVKTLIDAGRGVVFITHKLKEALTISDRIVVMRRGQVVGEVIPAQSTESQIAEMMVGRAVQLVVEKKIAQPGATVFSVQGLGVLDPNGRALVQDVSFDVHEGEIVGIAGVQGNGQTELVEALTGMRKASTGTVTLDGVDITTSSPRERHQLGIAHIPEDRLRQGLISGLTINENLVLTRYHDKPFSSGVVMHWDEARRLSEELVEKYDIRTPSAEMLASTLSGGNQQKVIVARELSRDLRFTIGNQQKVIVARELSRDLRLTIASQPTRGVDVGSIEYIHERIVEERDSGTAVLIVSTELDEVMALADRLFVMYRGQIVADLDPRTTSAMDVGLYMAGSSPELRVGSS